jgi:CBS domain-containing protein
VKTSATGPRLRHAASHHPTIHSGARPPPCKPQMHDDRARPLTVAAFLSILSLASEANRTEGTMNVQELMTREVASCQAADPCSAAAKLMWDHDCGSIPVLGEDGRLAGIITDRDICMAAWMRDRSPAQIEIGSVMSRDLHVCTPTDTVAASERLMRANQIRRLPVVDRDRRLLGILSTADIVRGTKDGRGGTKRVSEEVAATLAAICQPRADSGASAHA